MLQKILPAQSGEPSQTQSRFFLLAALFMVCYALILTLSPAVRQHSWRVSYLWVHWLCVVVWGAGFTMIHRKTVFKELSFDPLILPIVSVLIGWGTLSIFRISIYFGLRQTVWMTLGILLIYFGIGWKNLLSSLFRYKYVWITASIFLLALTLIFGTYPGGIGPELWLGGYGFYIQPSEILKILVIVYLAAYFSDFSPSTLTNARLLLPTLFIVGIASGILIFQRDMGTASIILLIYVLFVYMATQKRRMLVFGALVMILAAILGYSFFPVIQIRVSTWLNPWADAANSSYQIIQSLISVASGGLLGSGPGIGNPTIVPVSHSDFIFSSMIEETGLVGATTLIIFLMVLLHRIVKISLKAKSTYQRMLGAGLIIYLILQSILIMGGNLGTLPLTGVTLPFVSYGGSSLLSSIFAVLIWLHIDTENNEPGTIEIPSFRSILVIETILVIGLSIIWVFAFQWSVFRSNSLTLRTDNPRNAIADAYVARGKILDRNNKVLVETIGTAGTYQRQISNPALIQLTGYSNFNYGQSNLESSLNNYLRGLLANPGSEIFWNHLLYSQHPVGLNVRLTIDLDIQNFSDTLLDGHTGAIILMNPENGEIFALSSYPYLMSQDGDLETVIAEEFNNPDLPLINRAVHGLYPPGTAMTPFMFNWNADQNNPIDLPDDIENCLIQKRNISSWSQYIANGCNDGFAELSTQIPIQSWQNILDRFHFLDTPAFPLAQAELPPYELPDYTSSLSVTDLPLITPLQMAIAASVFSTEGTLAAPVLSYAVETPHQGWIVLPKNDAQTIEYQSQISSADFLNPDQQNFWTFLGKGERVDEHPVIWYASGTTQYWNGMPLMVIVLLEENAPNTARDIGEEVLFHALQLK
ncbi:MAG: FtsW/RodA/SpoVE family cell cycle protein [Anaerolineaceae bacterium]|nr:FtsW/RodA/SpoVE family cell cycle protein [Anaerolineaceae bacterium]